MKPKKIVITGGPGTGKSSVIHALEAAGYPCFHEVIRSMTLEAKQNGDPENMVSNPLAFVKDPFAFNRDLLTGRYRHFMEAEEMESRVVFFDRGMPDVLAYMDYFDQKYFKEFVKVCEENRYDKVLLLPPWKSIYVSDNERLESFSQAMEIHECLQATYTRFGYAPVTIPEATIGERAAHILRELTRENYL